MGARTADRDAPPAFIALADNPVRWRLLRELSRNDLRVDEMVAATRQPQPLVSYHLGRLRAGGLVTARRSAHDGRAAYYHLDLDRCGTALVGTGASLHPGIQVMAPGPAPQRLADAPAVHVVFACTGNSARSQMAEALLRRVGGAGIVVASAGSHPKPVHPYAIAAMSARGIDISGCRPKPLTELAEQRVDLVVTLCDKVRERCPEFPGSESMHWSIEDPSSGGPVTRARFDRLADELERRVRWLTWIIHTTHPWPHDQPSPHNPNVEVQHHEH